MADLSGVSIGHISGDGGSARSYINAEKSGETYELYIVHENVIYAPAVIDKVVWTTYRQGSPGSLSFTVMKDNIINFAEGDTVIFRFGGAGVFYGYVFTKSRSKNGFIQVTAYDQLRYLKNKDTYVYSAKRADEVFKMIAADYLLQRGETANTGYVIENRVEDNKELFDIIQNALDETYDNTGELYYIYDDFGKLCLKNVRDMTIDTVLDEAAASDFSYSSSIDREVYNTIQLYSDDRAAGERVKYIYRDGNSINTWGVLQYTKRLEEEDDPDSMGAELLNTYNRKNRELQIEKAFGDIRARAGASLPVSLNLGDVAVNSYMTVEKAVHTFGHGFYYMDLTLEMKI